MKMSDVKFETRMTEGSENISQTLTFIGSTSIDAIDHAVKNHDALVAMNAELVEALGRLLTYGSFTLFPAHEIQSIMDSHTKAKELSQ